MDNNSVNIRSLRDDDLAFCDEVRGIAGWNQTLTDWRRFISLNPDGCFLLECDGEPAGTATTTCYEGGLAWIGMVLVHPDFRRRGLGSALLNHAIEYLRDERGIRCIKLDATPEGRPLYEKLGFIPEWSLERWFGKGGGGTVDLPQDRLSEEALKLDREVFQADRSTLLASLEKGSSGIRTRKSGAFGLWREGMRSNYLGPVTVADTDEGTTLARELIQSAPAGDLTWDFPSENEAAVNLAKELGFESVRLMTRMYLGENSPAGDPSRMFGICEPGLG